MRKWLAAYIIEYLEENELSIEDRLLLIYWRVSKWVDKVGIVDVVYFDFSNILDVGHSLLLNKLQLCFDKMG